jgi:two-component sensor histidine kinase
VPETEPQLESEPTPAHGPTPAPVNASRSVALLSTDVHGRITAWTGDAEIRFGYSPGEMLGRGLHSLFRPSDSTGLHIEILTLPGWASSISSVVAWEFFHKQGGRQEATFTLIPLEQGGLSLILQEEHQEAHATSQPIPIEPVSPPPSLEQSVPDLEPAPVQNSVVESPVQQTEILEPASSFVEPLQQVPYEVPQPFAAMEPLAAVQPEAALAPETEASVDDEDDSMAPPPPLLDDLDAPDEWPGVPANLLEDNLPPIVEAPIAPPLSSIFDREQAFAPADPARVEPLIPAPSVEASAPLSLAPPQRMFANLPPIPPKPLSLAPPQSLYKDAAAAAAVEASLGMASKPPESPESPPPAPVPAPVVDPTPVPSVPQQRPSLEELQRERVLLGETHHRVKNHLQIITSMLNLQMSTLHNEEARDALRSSQNRVRSIAALHQHLYLLTTGESADFRAFATGLISHLRECYHVPKDRVSLMLHIPDRLLPEEWLMPLALALNEMVSNAFQHAWPDERSGSMSVTLTCGETPDGQPHGRLTVADDGIGLPPNFEQMDHPGMGMKILRVFAGQLGGEVKTRVGSMQGRGVTFELVFPSAR